MSQPTEFSCAPLPFARTSLLGLLLLLILVPPAAAAPFGVPDEMAAALVDELGERFEVIALTRGYVLRPAAGSGFGMIEIGEAGILVDGEAPGPDALAELLGDDAETVRALAGDPAALERRGEPRRSEERQTEAARELEESIRRQAEELERIDRDRLRDLNEELGRERRDRRRPVRTETRVSLGSSLTIDPEESARDVIVLLGPLDVRGEVRGDTVVVLGSVEVTGEMGGDLTVVGGKVSIGPDARVEGEVICVGGVVHRAPGARVGGEITEVSFAPFSFDFPGIEYEGWRPFRGWNAHRYGFRFFDFMGSIFNTILLAVLVLITLLAARKRVAAVAERAFAEPWKSGLVGFVVEVLIAPILLIVSILLLISVVGIPVLLVLLPLTLLMLVVLFFLGYAGVAVALGRRVVGGRREPRSLSPFAAILIGLLLIQSWQIFGEGLSLVGGLISFTGYLLIAFGFFLKYLAWTVGLGAVVLDRFAPLPAAGSAYAPPSPPPPVPVALPGLQAGGGEDAEAADEIYRQAGVQKVDEEDDADVKDAGEEQPR